MVRSDEVLERPKRFSTPELAKVRETPHWVPVFYLALSGICPAPAAPGKLPRSLFALANTAPADVYLATL
jgi:hypothetical protein